MKISKYLKKGDILIFISIIIIGIMPYIFLREDNTSGKPYIAVFQNNELIYRFDLNEKSESKFIDFDFYVSGKKYKGTLETKDSKVRLLRLPEEVVPLSIHSDMDYISDSKKIIVALPVSLVVSIENSFENHNEDKKDEKIDAISY